MQVFKRTLRASARLLVCIPYAMYFGLAAVGRRDRTFQAFSQCFSLIPGTTGEYLRREFYRLALKSCSADAVISFGTILSSPEAEIGARVYVGAYCVLGKVSVGNNTLIASRVSVVSGLQQHGIERTDIPIRDQEGIFRTVKLGEDCWIGEGAVIAADIGDHAVVGLGSIVIREVPEFAVVSGNPAERISTRG